MKECRIFFGIIFLLIIYLEQEVNLIFFATKFRQKTVKYDNLINIVLIYF